MFINGIDFHRLFDGKSDKSENKKNTFFFFLVAFVEDNATMSSI